MVDAVPPSSEPSALHRAAEDADRAQKLVEEAEKRRRREREDREKALVAESRQRAHGTNQRHSPE
ncbi:hypothetical protein [Amycolatopsis sp. lyj-112]|uniref:hypothetical protein n=1 Tax=Amycolatopsis sp. lyj-112 TaxID=2789288 RepID=UPI0039793124